MARILWSAEYHAGCTDSALPVVTELRRRGHTVVVLSVPEAEWRFRDLGMDFRPNVRFPVLDLGSASTDVPSGRAYLAWWRDLAARQFDDTMEALAQDPCDLVFGGGCMQLCGQGFAAERAGLPWVTYLDFLIDESVRREPEFAELWDTWRRSFGIGAEQRPPAESLWFPFSPQLTLYLVHRGLMSGDDGCPPYVHRVGATTWNERTETASPAWLETLGRDRPAVLVSPSSLWQDDADIVRLTAEVLRDRDVELVATVAAEHELGELPGRVTITGRFPHHLLIPRVDAVVCSAGLGTVTRALCAGIPVVAVPRSGDGWNVARALAASGAGIAIAPARLTTESLRAALDRALGDPALRAAAARWRGEPVTPAAITTAADRVEALLPAP